AVGRAAAASVSPAEWTGAGRDQPALAERLGKAGWSRVAWRNLTGGVVALHRGLKESWPPAGPGRTAAAGRRAAAGGVRPVRARGHRRAVRRRAARARPRRPRPSRGRTTRRPGTRRSEEHTSELQSREKLVCRLLLDKKKRHS